MEKLDCNLHIIAGMAAPVVTLSAWLMAEQFVLRQVAIHSTCQGIGILRSTVEHAGLPPHARLVWHGDAVDGNDGELSQQQFCQALEEALGAEREGIAVQVILGGGVNWMISLASQIAALYLDAHRGDGLWVLRTEPRFEHHPHFLKPDAPAMIFDPQSGIIKQADAKVSRLQRLLLLPKKSGRSQRSAPERVQLESGHITFLGRSIALSPLLLSLYKWLLAKTKYHCRRQQLDSCTGCVACALPGKEMAGLCDDFFLFYQNATHKPGYVRTMESAEFQRRVPEYISKINARIKQQGNEALHRQLRIDNTSGGYLPAVDKSFLGREE
ncbi:MAG: hypothetical protein H7833_07880 [Magnetococcus sp. DMHC-1]|nr:hypothetical protein [Magnetococcales bacterium]